MGPVLAAQMGYLPGMIWLLAGVVLPVRCRISWCCLFLRVVTVARWVSWSKKKMGPTAGVIALAGPLMIMVIILAVLAMIVKALTL